MKYTDEELEARLQRIENAITTMAWWLTQVPDCFGTRDARAIDDLLFGKDREFAPVLEEKP